MSQLSRYVLSAGLFFLSVSTHAQTVKTEGNCAPVVLNQGGTTNITVVCGDKNSQREAARKNISELLNAVRKLRITQAYYFLPALDRYADDPTEKNWRLAQVELDRTWVILQATIDASLSYAGTIKNAEDDTTSKGVNDVLRGRLPALTDLKSSPKHAATSDLIAKDAADKVVDQANNLKTSLNREVFVPPVSPRILNDWMSNYRILMAGLDRQIVSLGAALADLEKAEKAEIAKQ